MRHSKTKRIRKSYIEYGLIVALLTYGKINTTLERAKKIRPVFEKLLTKSKEVYTYKSNSDGRYLSSFRNLISALRKEDLAKKMIHTAGQYLMNRNGGYTRILKITHPRRSDCSSRAQISIITN